MDTGLKVVCTSMLIKYLVAIRKIFRNRGKSGLTYCMGCCYVMLITVFCYKVLRHIVHVAVSEFCTRLSKLA